jgi:hypothetical protein
MKKKYNIKIKIARKSIKKAKIIKNKYLTQDKKKNH